MTRRRHRPGSLIPVEPGVTRRGRTGFRMVSLVAVAALATGCSEVGKIPVPQRPDTMGG